MLRSRGAAAGAGRVQRAAAKPGRQREEHRHRPRRSRTCVASPTPASAAAGASATPSSHASPMSRSRFFRSRSRQRRRRRRTLGGVSEGKAVQSGSCRSTEASTSDTVSPSKQRLPVSISYSTAPNAQMSVRLSTGLPRACSGDMYAAVPITTPACVAAAGDRRRRRHVRRGAVERESLREPEVEDFDLPVRRDLDVGGLQVAMHDPLLVRRLERVGNLVRDRQRLLHRDRSGGDPFGERLSRHQLQDQRQRPVGFLQAVDRRDVRMVQRRQHLRFPLEASQPLGVRGEQLRAAP